MILRSPVARWAGSGSHPVLLRFRIQHIGLDVRRSVSGYQAAKATIPERLRIFQAGTGRSAFISCMKVTTIFIFTLNLCLNVPRVYQAPEYPLWAAPAVAVGGAIPMLYMIWVTAPFVAFIHMRVPLSARRSKEQLLRWAEKVPSDTELYFTTVKWYGRPRVSMTPVSDLKPIKVRFGIGNLVRDRRPYPGSAKNSKEPSVYFVGSDLRGSVESSIWRKVFAQIQAKAK